MFFLYNQKPWLVQCLPTNGPNEDIAADGESRCESANKHLETMHLDIMFYRQWLTGRQLSALLSDGDPRHGTLKTAGDWGQEQMLRKR